MTIRRTRLDRFGVSILCGVAALLAMRPTPVAALSFYQVGNSFTLDSKPEGTAAMLETLLGESVNYGYHIRGNQSLDSLWSNPTASGTLTTGFGDHTVALPGNSWDFLTLQTFQVNDPDNTLGQEVARIQDFVAAADRGGGGSTEIIIYGPWSGREERFWGGWDNDIPSDLDTRVAYAADYHDELYDQVAAIYPGRVRLASAGKVIREVRDRILAGEGPADSTRDLYRDFIHLSGGIGRFIASTAVTTTISRMNPVGMPVPRDVPSWGVESFTDEQALAIQQIVWEVLTEDKRSGVSPVGDLNVDTVVDDQDAALWSDSYGARTDLTADANGDGVVDQTDGSLWLAAYAPGPEDIDNSGDVKGPDYEAWRSAYGEGVGDRSDVNQDGVVDAADYTLWRDALRLADEVDFDRDGVLTASDLEVWQSQLGWASDLNADANDDGVVNAADYTIWRDGLAAVQSGGAPQGIPEPTTVVMLTIACASLFGGRRV